MASTALVKAACAICLAVLLFGMDRALAGIVQQAQRLHVLAVGVNEYRDRELPALKGCKNDAQAIARLFQSRALLRVDYTEVLLDETATRLNVLTALEELAQRSAPTDLVVIHFSSHATTEGEAALLLYDSERKAPVETGVSALELGSWLGRIAGRKFLIWDTHNGERLAATLAAALAPAGEQRLSVITSGGIVLERKFSGVMHGDTTIGLLQALAGGADQNKDRIVTARELEVEFLRSQLVRSDGSDSQHTFGRVLSLGSDFELVSSPLTASASKAELEKTAKTLVGPKGDVKEPTIELSSTLTRGEMVVTEETIKVTGRAIDEGNIIKVMVAGRPATLREDGHFDVNVPLSVGSNELEVWAFDAWGNRGAKVISVTRENLEPRRTLSKRSDYALLIATNKYDHWDQLSNPHFDVKALGEVLTSRFGFHVDMVLDPKREQVFERLSELRKRQFGEYDQVLIFVAGHGGYSELVREGFSAFVKSRKLMDDAMLSTVLTHTMLAKMADAIPSNHVLVVLDVCYGGTFDTRIADIPKSRGDPLYEEVGRDQFILRKLGRRTRAYLTSGGKQYVPDGRPGKHSPFARALLGTLAHGGGDDNILSLAELFSHLERIRPEPRAGRFFNDNPAGDFLFIAR